jgi:NADH-quinone oxidoreductase subunit N
MHLNNFWINFFYLNSELITLYFILSLLWIYLLKIFLTTFGFKVKKDDSDYLIYTLLVTILYFFFLISFKNLGFIVNYVPVYFFDDLFINSQFLNLVKYVMWCLLIFYFIFLLQYYKNFKLPLFEYIILILTCFLSLQFIIISNNFFFIFLCIELVNLCIYTLLGLSNHLHKNIECAYKYFIQSAYATIIGLFGLSLIYMCNGTLMITELSVLINNNYQNINIITQIGLIFIVLSIFFKIGLFPVHIWIGDIYQGSNLATLLFIATIPKIAYCTLFFNIFIHFSFTIQYISLVLSFITIIYGSILALYQTNLQRMIGYGSMSHMGLVIYTLSIGINTGYSAAAFFYLFFYAFLVFFLLSFIIFLNEKDSFNFLYHTNNISQIGVILYKNKILSILLVSIFLSLAGLPFFVGFISKWYIFLNLIKDFKIIELIILLLLSVLSSAYYIRLVRFLFFTDSKNLKILYYNNINNDKGDLFIFFLLFIFIFNIFIIFFHAALYAYIFKLLFYFI